MLDYHGKQLIGILLGIASIMSPLILVSRSFIVGDVRLLFIGVGSGLILSVIGIIFSVIGLKRAFDIRGSKAKGVIGLIVSICGFIYFIRLISAFSTVMLMAINSSEAASILII